MDFGSSLVPDTPMLSVWFLSVPGIWRACDPSDNGSRSLCARFLTMTLNDEEASRSLALYCEVFVIL